ncbi:MAG: redoxin domain-containing protein, partial [Chloroflexota bacterium]
KECEEQMPYLVGAYQQANGELVVLDIYHMIYDKRIIQDYVTEKQFTTFPALPDPKNRVATAYGATGFPPTNFIIDVAGTIKHKTIGPFQSQEEIESIIESL